MATPSEGPPYPIKYAEMFRCRSPQTHSVPTTGAYNAPSQFSQMEMTDMHTKAPDDVMGAFTKQHWGQNSAFHPQQTPSPLYSDTRSVPTEAAAQSSSNRETATSPIRSPDLRQRSLDASLTRNDYLRALSSIVMNHSAAKMSTLGSRKGPPSPKRRVVYNPFKGRAIIPRFFPRRNLASFQAPRITRLSPQAENNVSRSLAKNVASNIDTGRITITNTRNQSSSEESKVTDQKYSSSRNNNKTPSVLVQCSGEVVTKNCELIERPHLPASVEPQISSQIYTKCEDSSSENTSDVPSILVQCNGETVEHRCVQVQTLPSTLNLDEKSESSGTKSVKSEEKEQSIKRRRYHKPVIVKAGFTRSFILSKKRKTRRPENKRIFKTVSHNTGQRSTSSSSTPSGQARVSQSSKGTASLPEQSAKGEKTSSPKRRVTFVDERARDARLRRLKKKRRSKSISTSGNVHTSRSARKKAEESATNHEELQNDRRNIGDKTKQFLSQNEKRQDEDTISSDTSQNPQITNVNRSGTVQVQVHPSIFAGRVADTQNNLAKRDKDVHHMQTMSGKLVGRGNQTPKVNYVHVPRTREYGSEKKSIESCRNDIKRLADATRSFLEYRKSVNLSDKTRSTQGHTIGAVSGVTTPPALPPEESTIPLSSPAVPSNIVQRGAEILSNIRHQKQPHHLPPQPPKATGASGPFNKKEAFGMTATMGSTGNKHNVRALYSSPKRSREYKKYAPMTKSSKGPQVTEKRRGSLATSHDKKLTPREVVEQWLHSSAASSQQGEPPEDLSNASPGVSDSQPRPSTRDMAVNTTPRKSAIRKKGLRRRHSKKRRPSSTNLMSKKVKSKKASAAVDNNLDLNVLRYRSIDAHARCLEMLENSSSTLISDMANRPVPINEGKRSMNSKRKMSNMNSTDLALQRILQDYAPSPTISAQGTWEQNVRPGEMFATSHQAMPNMKLSGNVTSAKTMRMRFTSKVPKCARDKTFAQETGKGTGTMVNPLIETSNVTNRNDGSGISYPMKMQINTLDGSRPPEEYTFTNPQSSPIPAVGALPGLSINQHSVKQNNMAYVQISNDSKNGTLYGHANKLSRPCLTTWSKRRISVPCSKRHGGMSRRFHAPQWIDLSRRSTSLSHSRQYAEQTTCSGAPDLQQTGNAPLPNAPQYEGIGGAIHESVLMNEISGTEKERMMNTLEKLSYINRWSSAHKQRSFTSVSSRKTEPSSYSDVSAGNFRDVGKSNYCLPTKGFQSALVVSAAQPQGQNSVSIVPSARDVPHLIVQCTGGTITPHPPQKTQYLSPTLVSKIEEGKEKGKPEDNSPPKGQPHMLVSISWGGTGCSLQCQKGSPSETTQALTLPPNTPCIKDGADNVTISLPNVAQRVSAVQETIRRQKRQSKSPAVTASKRAEPPTSKGKLGKPGSRSGTPKVKQGGSMPTVSWGTSRRRNTPAASGTGNAKSLVQSLKRDKTAPEVAVKGPENMSPGPTRGMKQRSKAVLPGPGVKNPASPSRKINSASRNSVTLPRIPIHGQDTCRKLGERPGKDRIAPAQASEIVNASVQVSRRSSAVAASRKESAFVATDKRDGKELIKPEKSAATSPDLSSKLVEAYVQTSEETPWRNIQSFESSGNYLQIKGFPSTHARNVAVSVQTSDFCLADKADASFQTSVSRMLVPPKLSSDLTPRDPWNSDFFKQTQRYLTNVASVLASHKMKALVRASEEDAPKKTHEVEVILPERNRRETNEERHRSSSSSRATSTADASIQTPKTSIKHMPIASTTLIQRTLRDAANLLQRHRSLSAPQAPVSDKKPVRAMGAIGAEGALPCAVRSGPENFRECDTPSAVVTSDTSESSDIPPSVSRSMSKKGSANGNHGNEHIVLGAMRPNVLDTVNYVDLEASRPPLPPNPPKTSPSPFLKRSSNTSHCISSALQNYGYQRRGVSSSVLMHRVDKVPAPLWRKGDPANVISSKGPSVIHNQSPTSSPGSRYITKVQAIGDPIKPPLPPPRKLGTYSKLLPTRSSPKADQPSKPPMAKKFLQILQPRSPSRPKPVVLRLSKKMRGKVPLRKSRTGSVNPGKQSAPAMETPAPSGWSAIVRSGSSTPRAGAARKCESPPGGAQEGEAGQPPNEQDAKANALLDATSHAQRSKSTGATPPRVRQTPGSLLVVMPRVSDTPALPRHKPSGL